MYCLIADLITEVPEAGGLAPRCQAYLYDGNEESDIVTTLNGEVYNGEEIVNSGKYELIVVATDNYGNQSTKIINFRLNNHPKKDKKVTLRKEHFIIRIERNMIKI